MKPQIVIIAEIFLEQNPEKETFTLSDLQETVVDNIDNPKLLPILDKREYIWSTWELNSLLMKATKTQRPKIKYRKGRGKKRVAREFELI